MRSFYHSLFLIMLFIALLYPAGSVRAAEAQRSVVSAPLVVYTNAAPQVIRLMFPGNWIVTADGKLTLEISVSLGAAPNSSALFLSVSAANELLEVIPLARPGLHTLKLVLPQKMLETANESGTLDLALDVWNDSGCGTWGGVTILPTSRFDVPHRVDAPNLNLAQFPKQLLGEDGKFEPILFVLPDQPTLGELQAGITLATGLGWQTNGDLPVLLVSESHLTDDIRQKYNLLYIGKTSSLDILTRLILPMPVLEDDFLLPDRYEFEHTGQTDGVLQMIVSPWNDKKVMLIVSASGEVGIQNAAKALSLGNIRTNIKENAAIVKNVMVSPPTEDAHPLNASMQVLGYQNYPMNHIGAQTTQFLFQVPMNSVVSANGWVEFVYEVPLPLNPENSSVYIYLNNHFIGVLPLNTVAQQQKIRLPLPTEYLQSGQNTLTVAAHLAPVTFCRNAGLQPTWLMLFASSEIKLQPGFFEKRTLIPDPTLSVATENLVNRLGQAAFVLQSNEPETWQVAIQLAATLGAHSDGALAFPSVYIRTIPTGERTGKNIIFVGRASQFPLLTELGDTLPAPFDAFSDRPSEAGLDVVFRVSYDDPVGYLQLAASPWDKNRIILVVVGNTLPGVALAGNAFRDPDLRAGMASAFVVVSADELVVEQVPR